MKRILSILLVAVPAAVVALLWTSTPTTAQPVPPPGLRVVTHGDGLTGSGTTAAPLNLAPQACGGGSAVTGWGSDGTPTCVAAGTTYTAGDGIDITGTVVSADLAGASCSTGQFVSALSGSGAGTCSAPTDNDHALVTSQAIPKGDGSTQVASLLTDDGTTVSNAGDTDLSAGKTTVGQVVGTTETSSATTLDDYPLGATTRVLFLDGASPALTGMTGGVDGRQVKICHVRLTASTLVISNESSGSTAGNRFVIDNGVASRLQNNSCTDAVYVGDVSRWVVTDDLLMTGLTVTGAGTIGGSFTVTGVTTLNNQLRVGTGNIASYVNQGTASPTSTAWMITNNGASGGYLTSTPLGRDDVHLAWDADYTGSTWTARDTSWASIAKYGDKLNFLCGSGATAGSSIATAYSAALAAPCLMLDLATGRITTGNRLTVGGDLVVHGHVSLSDDDTYDVDINGTSHLNGPTIANAAVTLNDATTIGDSDNDSLNVRATLAFSGTDVSAGSGASAASGEAQSFTVTCGTGITNCRVNFNRTFNSTPFCTLSKASSAADDAYVNNGSSSTTYVTISFTSATAKLNSYNVSCPDRMP